MRLCVYSLAVFLFALPSSLKANIRLPLKT
jgi:hypothetical protein